MTTDESSSLTAFTINIESYNLTTLAYQWAKVKITKWRSLQRFDRKRLQIDGLFKPRCGNPPRVPTSRHTAFIATNAAQTQLQKAANAVHVRPQTQSLKAINAAFTCRQTQLPSCQTQLSTRCQRSFQIAASELPNTAFERRIRIRTWILRLTRSNTSWTVPKPFPTIWGDHNSTQEWFEGRLHPISPT